MVFPIVSFLFRDWFRTVLAYSLCGAVAGGIFRIIPELGEFVVQGWTGDMVAGAEWSGPTAIMTMSRRSLVPHHGGRPGDARGRLARRDGHDGARHCGLGEAATSTARTPGATPLRHQVRTTRVGALRDPAARARDVPPGAGFGPAGLSHLVAPGVPYESGSCPIPRVCAGGTAVCP